MEPNWSTSREQPRPGGFRAREQTAEGVLVYTAVDAVDEGLQGFAVRGERTHGYSS
jgi:hypothetical protein